jgi:hypothetical protein
MAEGSPTCRGRQLVLASAAAGAVAGLARVSERLALRDPLAESLVSQGPDSESDAAWPAVCHHVSRHSCESK